MNYKAWSWLLMIDVFILVLLFLIPGAELGVPRGIWDCIVSCVKFFSLFIHFDFVLACRTAKKDTGNSPEGKE